MLIKRTKQQIISLAVETVSQNTKINNFHAGAIARSLVEALGPEYENLYDFAQDILDQGFLSKANDEHLALIGELFSYPRRMERVFDQENDIFIDQPIDTETYRYELSQQVHVAATANEAALRLAILQVPGVMNAIGKEYTHGTGSFMYILVPQYGFEAEEVLYNVKEAVQKIKGFGIKPTIVLPTVIPMEVTLQLVFHEALGETERQRIRTDTKAKIYDYVGNLSLGQPFIYNDMVQEVMNSDKNIIDFKVVEFYLNNEPALLTNQNILEDERIRPRLINVI
jgi:Baseplate J-like protein